MAAFTQAHGLDIVNKQQLLGVESLVRLRAAGGFRAKSAGMLDMERLFRQPPSEHYLQQSTSVGIGVLLELWRCWCQCHRNVRNWVLNSEDFTRYWGCVLWPFWSISQKSLQILLLYKYIFFIALLWLFLLRLHTNQITPFSPLCCCSKPGHLAECLTWVSGVVVL